MILTHGYILQLEEQLDGATGGNAVIEFSLTNAGKCVIPGMVNAEDESANLFYVNVDDLPEDPAMIWDIERQPDLKRGPSTGAEPEIPAAMNLFPNFSSSPPARINSSSWAGSRRN